MTFTIPFIKSSYSLKSRRVQRIIAVQLIFLLIAVFYTNSSILSVHDTYNNIINVNGTIVTATTTNTNSNYDSPSYCNNEGSLHQIALDMFHHSSPPGSASYTKLKHVLGKWNVAFKYILFCTYKLIIPALPYMVSNYWNVIYCNSRSEWILLYIR